MLHYIQLLVKKNNNFLSFLYPNYNKSTFFIHVYLRAFVVIIVLFFCYGLVGDKFAINLRWRLMQALMYLTVKAWKIENVSFEKFKFYSAYAFPL